MGVQHSLIPRPTQFSVLWFALTEAEEQEIKNKIKIKKYKNEKKMGRVSFRRTQGGRGGGGGGLDPRPNP